MKKLLKSLSLILVFLFVMTTLFSAAILSVSAQSKEEYTEFTLLEDKQTIISNYKTYRCFKLDPIHKFTFDPLNVYCYANEVKRLDGGSRASAYATEKGAELMWIENAYGEIYYFYTDAEKEHITNEFLKEKFTYRRLWTSDGRYSDVSENIVSSLQELYATQAKDSLSVRYLNSFDKYRLAGYDRTGTLAYELGYIYVDSDYGDYFYVAHSKLSESYFDEDGNFVYVGTGTVKALALNGNLQKAVSKLIAKAEPAEYTYTYEDERYNYDYNDDFEEYDPEKYERSMVIAFWIVLFIVGIIVPIPIFIVGMVLSQKNDKDHPKYWRSIAFSAAAWLFFTIVLMAILIVI